MPSIPCLNHIALSAFKPYNKLYYPGLFINDANIICVIKYIKIYYNNNTLCIVYDNKKTCKTAVIYPNIYFHGEYKNEYFFNINGTNNLVYVTCGKCRLLVRTVKMKIYDNIYISMMNKSVFIYDKNVNKYQIYNFNNQKLVDVIKYDNKIFYFITTHNVWRYNNCNDILDQMYIKMKENIKSYNIIGDSIWLNNTEFKL